MDTRIITLDTLPCGQWGTVTELRCRPDAERRFQDMGLVPGTRIKCVMKSPLSDPCAYLIRDAVIAIRRQDGKDIYVGAAM